MNTTNRSLFLRLLSIVLAGVFTACDGGTVFPALPCEPEARQVDSFLEVPDGVNVVYLDSILLDNRCPDNAVCVIAGGVAVQLVSGTDTLKLESGDTGLKYGQRGRLGDFTVQLDSVKSEKTSTVPDPEDYCFYFSFVE